MQVGIGDAVFLDRVDGVISFDLCLNRGPVHLLFKTQIDLFLVACALMLNCAVTFSKDHLSRLICHLVFLLGPAPARFLIVH